MAAEGYATGASNRAATPAHDQRSTATARGRPAQRLTVGGRQRQDVTEALAESLDVAGRERGQVAEALRVGLLEPRRDLGEAAVPGDERRAAAGGRLGGNHAERLREDRRHDRDVGEREQVREVAVLERPGEEDAPGRGLLELGPVVAEPDDHRPRVEPVERLEQQVDALVLDQLPEVDDESARRRRGRPRAAAALPSSGSRSSRVPGVGRVGAGLGEQVGERLVRAPAARTRRRRRRAAPRRHARRGR